MFLIIILALGIGISITPAHAQDDPICPQPKPDHAALNRVMREKEFWQRETDRLRLIVEGLIGLNLEQKREQERAVTKMQVEFDFQSDVIRCWREEAKRPVRSKVDVCGTMVRTH